MPPALSTPIRLRRPSCGARASATTTREMVCRITTSGAGVEVVVGKAGAGKTFALDAPRAAWQSAGHQVIGTALAARAAAELQDGSGIPSGTLHGLLDHFKRGLELNSRTVVVVDEAGMVGTRQLARLIDHCADVRANSSSSAIRTNCPPSRLAACSTDSSTVCPLCS